MSLRWVQQLLPAAAIMFCLLFQSKSSLGAVTPQLAAGGSHTMALMTDGSVRTWGYNAQGQLGNNTLATSAVPVSVAGLAGPVKAIAAGVSHSVALLADGTVQAWGNNEWGQLGDGTTTTRLTPVTVNMGGPVVAIAAGTSHTLALLADGTVKACGLNSYGQLGDGTSSNRLTPVTVINLGGPVTAIASGSYHSVALLADGTLRAWGYNASGQLGNGTYTNSVSPSLVTNVGGLVTSMTTGGYHTLARLSDGTIRAWGNNTYGQLGNGSSSSSPVPVSMNLPPGGVAAVAGGGWHTVALLTDGTLMVCGRNHYGQLGTGLVTGSTTPVPLAQPTGVTALATGTLHTVVLQAGGRYWSWGNNSYGQLGTGTTSNSSEAVGVVGLGGAVVAAAGGDIHTLARMSDGTVRAWGGNANGQLGTGNLVGSSLPLSVDALVGQVNDLAAGYGYGMALLASGEVRAWGNNMNGQLGDGSNTNRLTPVLVAGLGGSATAVAAGYNHSAALLADGSVRTWGNNGSGQLGTGNYLSSTTPVPVSNLGGRATAIAVGYNFTMALLEDGTVKTWGNNGSGQLGIGNFINSATPVTVFDLGGPAKAIAAGGYFALALLQDGTVKAWGYNSAGQLGDGTTVTRTMPVTVVIPAGMVTAIAAGDAHALAVLLDGSLLAWGNNLSGQLGDGSLVSRSTPITVAGVFGVRHISAGDAHSVAVLNDDTVKAWGNNSFGQLGDGRGPSTPQIGLINLDNLPPTVGCDPQGGVYQESINVTLTCSDDLTGCQGVYYTDDGSAPTWPVSGTTKLYTGPLTVAQSTNLAYLAVDQAGNASGVSQQGYNFPMTTAPLTIIFVGEGDVMLSTGQVCHSGCSQSIPLDTTVNLVPTVPGGGYTASWSGCDNVSGTTCRVSVTAPRSVTVTFIPRPEPGVSAVWSGIAHTLALLTDGTVMAWGGNGLGQLGNGTTTNVLAPVAISSLAMPVASLAAGGTHSVALYANGTLAAWGDNSNGQLGDGTVVSRMLPVQVLNLEGPVISVAAGAAHTLALLADGTVMAWGGNGSGQLGDGTTSNRMLPVRVSGLNGPAIAIAAGSSHSLALMADGSVMAWGYNSFGQLGDGTTATRVLPVQVIDLGGLALAIAAGGSHSLALLADGTVRAWGYNGQGQLGNGTIISASRPVSPTQLGNGVVAIAAGNHHSLALMFDGTIRTWGDNLRGQLGNGTNFNNVIPGEVAGGLGGVSVIAAGSASSFAITNSGGLYGWGWNASGQVGNNATVDVKTPLAVYGVTEACNVKMGGTCYATVAEAYAAASDGATILLQGIAYGGSLAADRPVAVTLQGGYGADFISRIGVTSLADLTVANGTLVLDEVTLQ